MQRLELVLWLLALLLLGGYGGARIWGELERERGLAGFYESRFPAGAVATPETDSAAQAIAVLRIPRISLEVPTYHGTEETVLTRGAGLVNGTAAPGSNGNVVIAAHRDSFFRGLKDVVVGDLIELETAGYIHHYRISGLTIVAPDAVEVMHETGFAVLTLITCYPFYFVGNAPQRFIVRAEATGNTIRPPAAADPAALKQGTIK